MSEPTYVLVPGAGGAAWFWSRVASELRGRGLTSVAVDLPADDPGAGLAEYVATIVSAAVDARDVVLVGASLNGFAASLAAPELPVSRLVLVNAMIPAPGETAGEWGTNTDAAGARRANDVREGRDPDADFDDDVYFFHDLAPGLVAESLAHDRQETDTVFGQAWDLPSWPNVPTRVVVAREDRLFPADFQRRVARERLGADVEIVEVPGGHMAPLSHPLEVADALVT